MKITENLNSTTAFQANSLASKVLNPPPDSNIRTSPKPRRRTRNPSLTRLKRVGAPIGRHSGPKTPLLKWKIKDRVVNVDDEDGGEAAREEEKKNGGSKGRRRSVKVVTARRLAARLWRLQLSEMVVGGGGQRRRSRKDLVGF